ncbi:SMP-30/gluconolactonase/LRE family protein [Chelatococcus asaccharovorans]|uniref:Gluconolactonase n=1 Tax=Chelatococcus asaccharovorans TaxID=28210 RepID=A0A2V3TXF0_9HYPH|nr:SMP-30/gluconolactonase/LRE family protein [Chelatococcus asaccharovorans]MBS7705168.1 SMP-30/gluconolactonase/LRE family protein [Chelatococcus asaccharovorans]PXW53665.1 gluconolactonase [Chelatococcus asaccharovorans]
MVQRQPELFADGLVFGEGMRWYGGRLWMSDMLGRKVYSFDEVGQRRIEATVPERPNGLGFLPSGALVTTSMADQKLLRMTSDGSLAEHADLSHLMTGYCGDMAVDAQGRAYLDDVGFRVFEGEPPAPGRLLLVQADGSASVLESGLQFPNGMAITQDGKELIFAEGRNRKIWSYELADDGTFASKSLFSETEDLLDGMTLDVEGGVWQCMPYRNEIVRYLRGGRITQRIPFGALKPVACALGGHERRILYVVVCDYSIERMARDDTTAQIFAVDVDVPGFALPGDRAA